MLEVVDPDVEPGSGPNSLPLLAAVLQPLHGMPFLFTRESYGGEVMFHFGPKVFGRVVRGKQLSHGAAVLSPWASDWEIVSALRSDIVHSADLSEEALHAAAAAVWITPGATVSRVEPEAESRPDRTAIGLMIALSDGSTVRVRPGPAGVLPDWTVLLPDGSGVRVGPGSRWRFEPPEPPPPLTVRKDSGEPYLLPWPVYTLAHPVAPGHGRVEPIGYPRVGATIALYSDHDLAEQATGGDTLAPWPLAGPRDVRGLLERAAATGLTHVSIDIGGEGRTGLPGGFFRTIPEVLAALGPG
jgi:hypothetical protein